MNGKPGRLIRNRGAHVGFITGSVLLPVYNGAKYLAKTLNSIARAVDSHTEVVIIDDGSTDTSWEVIQKFASNNSQVCLYAISRDNHGMVATLAELVQSAEGEILYRIDCDDICRPQRFREQKGFLDRNPGVVLVGSNVTLIDPQGRLICDVNLPINHDEIVGGLLMERGFNPVPIFHPSVAMRKKSVIEVGNYDISLEACEDRDLWLRLARVGALANITDSLIYYRLHLESFSHTRADLQEKYREKVVSRARRSVGLDVSASSHLFHIRGRQERLTHVYFDWATRAARAGNFATAFIYFFKLLLLRDYRKPTLGHLVCLLRYRMKVFFLQ